MTVADTTDADSGGSADPTPEMTVADTTDADSGGSADPTVEVSAVDTTDVDSGGSHEGSSDFSGVDFSDADSGGGDVGGFDSSGVDFSDADSGGADVGGFDGGGFGGDDGFDAEGFGDIGDVWPVVLDMDGDGVEITPVHESTAFFDMNDDGFRNLTGWATGGDGLLAYDQDSDGVITSIDEIAFIGYLDGAQSDLEGLNAFDTNADGVLSADDAQWAQFGVWIDANQDGVNDAGEFQSLDHHGITEIALTSDGVEQPLDDGGRIVGMTTATTGAGESIAAADAVLRYTQTGYRTSSDGYAEFGSADSERIGIANLDQAVSVDLGASELNGFVGSAEADVIDAGAALDVVIASGAGDDRISGGDGADWLSGGVGADQLVGGAGEDVLFFDNDDVTSGLVDGGDGFDIGIVEGNAGVEISADAAALEALIGFTGDDKLRAGTAIDVYLAGGLGDDELVGGAGDDFLVGGLGVDSLSGGDGDDFLFIDASDSVVDGGAGVDALVVESEEGVNIDLAATSVEVAFGNAGNDVLDAGEAAESVVIDGGAGDDMLTGGQLDDLLIGGHGADAIDGGAGFDAASYAGILEDHMIGFDSGTGSYLVEDRSSGDVDVIRNVEALTFGSEVVWLSETEISTPDAGGQYQGSDAGELFAGTAGSDVVVAQDGNDLLLGGDGDDDLDGGLGNDYLDGGSGDDVLFGDEGNDYLRGHDGNDRVIGGKGDDIIYAGDGDDMVQGWAGDDQLFGGDGNDTIWAGAGEDILFGGNGNDRMGGRDGNDIMYGGAGDDWMAGGDGDDIIYSGAGNDLVYNGAGNDVLVFDVGDGKDDFRFWDPNWGSAHDTLRFGGSLSHEDLWVSFDSSYDLVFDVIGTDDQVSVHNWRYGVWARPEAIETSDGYTLSQASVYQLVSALAQISGTEPSDAVLDDPNMRAQVNEAIAAAWQPKEAVA